MLAREAKTRRREVITSPDGGCASAWYSCPPKSHRSSQGLNHFIVRPMGMELSRSLITKNHIGLARQAWNEITVDGGTRTRHLPLE